MTRIIAGTARSLSLNVPSSGTRPTSDRVREALFSSLDSADLITGSRVLDLYAGSGALAFEAISRGAASADLVEAAPSAANVIAQNITKFYERAGREHPVTLHRQKAEQYLRGLSPQHKQWDLVFIDPPYDLSNHELKTVLELLLPLLSEDALLIVERDRRSGAPELPHELVIERDRKIGDTKLWWIGAELAD